MFAENILESSVVEDILTQICEFGGPDVVVRQHTSLDREGGNHEIVGYVRHADQEYGFRVVSGNWNGTEVLDWELDGYFSLTDRSSYYD